MIALFLAMLAQGPASYDLQFQREEAANTAYAACLFRENDRRRASGRSDLNDFGRSCTTERAEIVRLSRAAERAADVTAAGLSGFETTFRENVARMNKFYPSGPAHAQD